MKSVYCLFTGMLYNLSTELFQSYKSYLVFDNGVKGIRGWFSSAYAANTLDGINLQFHTLVVLLV